ncbi:MAG TPA: CapA family protein, partial [Roseiflexaceae bacterium]
MSHNERTFCVLRSALCALLCCLLVTLAACAGPRAGVPAAQPTVVGVVQAATPAPQRTAAPVDERQWRVLYRRAGWDGGAAVDLRAVGDIMLGRLVADIAARRGYGYPFEQARPLLNGDPSPGSGQALAIGNLESPLTERRAPLRAGPYRLPAPTAFAAPLAGAGFRALSLANNHALDAGPAGLQDAAGALAAAGVAPLGAGPDAETARKPLIVDSNGLRVALLAFNAVADPEDQPGEGRGWGRAWLDDAALAAVGQARTDAGVVVVLVHWGREYAAQPSDLQRAWARRLVAAGADLVVGAHPHVLQPIETIAEGGRSGVVAYSLGNFVFDQEFSPATGTGAALRFMLDRQGVALAAAAPFEIVAGQPRPLALDGDAGQAVIESLACHRDYRDREHDPKPLCDLCALCGSKANEIAAWRWDGQTATAVDVPAGTVLGARPERLPADLRGDGRPLWAALDASGMVELRDGAA